MVYVLFYSFIIVVFSVIGLVIFYNYFKNFKEIFCIMLFWEYGFWYYNVSISFWFCFIMIILRNFFILWFFVIKYGFLRICILGSVNLL